MTESTTRPNQRRRVWSLVAATLGASLALGAVAATATALPPPCYPDCSGGNQPPPPPSVTTIYGATPDHGWSADQITISGWDLAPNATVTISSPDSGVTFSGQPTILSDTNTTITLDLPTIHSTTAGPVSLILTVTDIHGTASTKINLSGSLDVEASHVFMNSSGGQDGIAWAKATVDRLSGNVTWDTTPGTNALENYQFPWYLSVNVSVIWLNAQNQVVGYTNPQNVTAPPAATVQSNFQTTTIGPNGGVGPQIHSAQIVMVRDHSKELMATLSAAFQAGQTIVTVLSKLAAYM